jgi:hypothetical protein
MEIFEDESVDDYLVRIRRERDDLLRISSTPLRYMPVESNGTTYSVEFIEFLNQPISDFTDLSARTRTYLERHTSIQYVGQLVQKRGDELLSLPGFGKKTLRELEDFLDSYGVGGMGNDMIREVA